MLNQRKREKERKKVMSHCVVPKWNLMPQRQEELIGGEEGNTNSRSSHVHIQNNLNSHHLHTSDYDVAELTWENGHLAMHGFGGLQPTGPVPSTKPTWLRPNDTLESIVHQATTCHNMDKNNASFQQNMSSMVASSGGDSSSQAAGGPGGGSVRKRTRTESDQCGRNFNNSLQEVERSVCASASATFCKDNDRTMMTWASFESPRSMKTKTTDEDSACHDGPENRDDDQETKGETGRSHSMRRSRAAAVHNQSERRRRDRINQKMKALQKLVPNSSKTDKASMLDEVIEYLKQLQAQIQMMNTVRNMPQMMLPMGIHQHQQQLQMSLLARMTGMGTMGLGMGMGMLDMSAMARTAPQSLNVAAAAANPAFVQSPFVMPAMIPGRASQPQPSSETSSNASVPMHDPYAALFAQQSMNMDMYNKMAALYRQQVNQTAMGTTNQPHSNHDQRS